MGLGESVKNAFKFEEDKKQATDTGREGVPGAITEGDPAMGGKYTNAENTGGAASHGVGTQGGGALDVQSGDPAMGGKHTTADGGN